MPMSKTVYSRGNAHTLSRPPCRHGTTLIYSVVLLVVLSAFSSLAVDLGRVQLAKTELRRAVDAAVRYGSTGLSVSPATARARAKAAAADNAVDGVALSLSDADIQLGTWNSSTKTFTALSGSGEANATAIRILAGRSASKGNAIQLSFGRVIGISSCNISASGVAEYSTGETQGVVGLNGITFKNNTFLGSYNSGSTSNPSEASAGSNAAMASNAEIYGKKNNKIKGNVRLGPDGAITGITVTGSTTNQSTAIEAPESPAWSPTTNPGGISQTYTVNSNTTLPGGTYYFTSLIVNATLEFSSATTVYINGNVDINDELRPTSLVPSDLKVYQIGTHSFGDSKNNNIEIVAVISAPNSAFVAKNNLKFRGSMIFNTITTKNNADFFYDEALGQASGMASISTVE